MYGLLSLTARIGATLAGLAVLLLCAVFLVVIQGWGLVGILVTVIAAPVVGIVVPLWALIGYGIWTPIAALVLLLVVGTIAGWADQKDSMRVMFSGASPKG
jgi:hypothetical protein